MKVKFLIAALFFSLVAAAQPSNYIKFNTRGRWIAGMFDSTLHVPRFNGSPSLRTGGSSMDGAIAIDTTNNIMYFYSGGSWKRANLDTSAYAVTSVYRKTASDSVFYVKGGVHTFAFKDSTGGGTPTLQQVLTAGSTLTQNNTITGGLYSFKFTNQNLWSVDTARQWRLRSFRQSDSSMQLIQSSNYGVSGLKRINISSQDTDYFSNIIIDHDHLTNEVYERNPLTLKTAFGQDYNRFSFQGDTTIMLIEANNRRVGIMTAYPDSSFHVVGGLKFVTGRQGAGKVLTSDANGGADWATPSGGSYTFTNGLTDSSGTVKLGGTLTEHTTIDGNNKIFEYVDGNSFTIAVNDQIQILSNANGFETNSTSATIKAAGTGKESMIIVSPDSIAYNPHLGVMRIDTLAAASNMTNKKVMVWDTVTKRWEQIAKDSVGGGGSTTPAGNYGNLQLNRNGAFATPASDSLDFESTTGLSIKGDIRISDDRELFIGGSHQIKYNTSANTTYLYGGYNWQFQNGGHVFFGGNTTYFSPTGDLYFTSTNKLGIGTTSPSARLHISAPTSTANTGQLKLASGTPPTTPEIGLINFQDGLLFLDSSNSNRDTVATRDWVNYKGYVSTRDRFGFSGEDVLSSADRVFNLNNNKFDFDSGSLHIKAKVTSPRSDDIFSVGSGTNKVFYIDSLRKTYATELYAGSGSFYAIGGLAAFNGTDIRLNGTTKFSSFQKKFQFIKEYPALLDSIGAEFSNDTLNISTLGASFADTYRIVSMKYRSGVDNSETERFDFRGNGDLNITGTGATKFQSGNTAQRPATPTTGMMRYNTDSTSFEYYNGSAWLKFGTASGGSSDGYVDNATFNTTTNYLTIEQTGAADVSVRIPPSYIRNALNADSISKKENDSTLLLKAITVTTNNNRLTTTVTRTDSTINFLVDIKRDTVTLASFGAGGGQAGDTTAFSTSTIYGSFYNDGTDTLVITSMRGILQGTSPSVTYDVYYNDSLNVTAGASKLVTAGTALTNTATGAAVTSFDNTKIPPGVWVWVKTTTVTTKPTYFSLSLVGYKSRKA